MGLINSKTEPTIERVKELAIKAPVSTEITREEAASMLKKGKEASEAAKRWWEGELPSKIIIPSVQGKILPSLFDEEPGDYNFGMIIKAPKPIPLVFSSNKLPSVIEVVDALDLFISELSNSKYDKEIKAFLYKIIDNYLYGRRDILLPNWVYKRLNFDSFSV